MMQSSNPEPLCLNRTGFPSSFSLFFSLASSIHSESFSSFSLFPCSRPLFSSRLLFLLFLFQSRLDPSIIISPLFLLYFFILLFLSLPFLSVRTSFLFSFLLFSFLPLSHLPYTPSAPSLLFLLSFYPSISLLVFFHFFPLVILSFLSSSILPLPPSLFLSFRSLLPSFCFP